MREPDWQQGNVKLYLGDCLELLPQMEPVEACLTDPPYGLSFGTEQWDDAIPLEWLDQARRASPLVAFTTSQLSLWDYPKPDWVGCWHRPAAKSRIPGTRGFSHWTPILVYGKHRLGCDTISLHALENSYSTRGTKPKVKHPCPKPERLALWMVKSLSKTAVLDPFMGSGTAGVAAIRLGRSFVGIEKNPQYFEEAAQRLEIEMRQPSLFSERQSPLFSLKRKAS